MTSSYLQFFRGSYNPRVTKEVKRIIDNVNNVLRWKPNNPFSIRGSDVKGRIYINCDGKHTACAKKPEGTPFAMVSQELDTNKEPLGSMILFCDPFFQAPRFDKEKATLTAAQPPALPNIPISADQWYCTQLWVFHYMLCSDPFANIIFGQNIDCFHQIIFILINELILTNKTKFDQ
jgi:hypothetical protein